MEDLNFDHFERECLYQRTESKYRLAFSSLNGSTKEQPSHLDIICILRTSSGSITNLRPGWRKSCKLGNEETTEPKVIIGKNVGFGAIYFPWI